MSDNGATNFPTQIAVTCGFCSETNDVKWFCKSCAGSMCNTCKSSHPTIPVFKNHNILPRSNDVMRLYGPSKLAEQCKIHPEKEISTYCNECQVPCCVTCQVKNHKRHDISSIEDAYLSAEDRLNDNVRTLEKDVLPILDEMAERRGKDLSEKKDQTNNLREEVNNFRKKLKQVVDESCDGLLEKLDRNDMELERLITRIDAQRRKVRVLVKEIDGIIQKGDLDMIKYSPPSPGSLIPEVPIPKLTIPVFTPGREILTIIRNKVGKIEWNDVTSEPKPTPSSCLTSFDPSIHNIRKVNFLGSKIFVTGITAAGNNRAWVMYHSSDTMYLYDSSGKVVRSITVKGSNGINDMVIRQSGEMIVTCTDMKIRRVLVSDEVFTMTDTSPFVPDGICLTEREDVVVCMRNQNEGSHLTVISPDTGEKVQKISGIDGQGEQQITDPYRVVYDGKNVCVVNESPNNVVCVDVRGDVRWLYDGKHTKLTYVFTPRGISVDKYSYFLVTDYVNNCVHYIDGEGRLIEIIMTQEETGLDKLWGICVDDKTSKVWIGNWSLSKGSSASVVISDYL